MATNIKFLFEPISWRGRAIPSRIILAAINTGFANAHRPTIQLLRFHKDRAGPNIGISFIGNVAITRGSVSNPQTPVLQTRSDVGRFAAIARAIKETGSLAGIQLASAPIDLSPSLFWRCRDARREERRLRHLVMGLSEGSIAESLEQFVNSTRLAATSGFDVIQIHAAHGYLLSLLLSSVVNMRYDRFSFDGRWLDDFVAQLQVADALLSFRISTKWEFRRSRALNPG